MPNSCIQPGKEGEASWDRALGRVGWALWAAGAAWVLSLVVRSLDWPVINDATLFHYVAFRIAGGAVPYEEVFDFQFPGTLLVHLAVVETIGASDAAWRAFDLAWVAAGGTLLFRLIRPCGLLAASVAPLLFVAWHVTLGAWDAGQRDFLVAVLLLAAARSGVRLFEGDRVAARALVAGLSIGAAATIKPPAVLALVALLPAAWRAAGRGRTVRVLAAAGAGAAAAPAVAFGWLWSSGGLGAFYEIVTEYLIPLHPRMERVPARKLLVDWLGNAFALPLLVLCVLAVARGPFHGPGFRTRAVLLLGLGYGTVHALLQAKGWTYHFDPAVAFLVALASTALAAPSGTGWRRAATVVAWCAGLVLCTRAMLVIAPRAERQVGDTAPTAAVRRTVDGLVADLAHLAPDPAPVQVIDSGSAGIEALLRAERVQPSRFTYDHPLYLDDGSPYVASLRRELLDDLRATPPAAVIVFGFDPRTGTNDRLTRFPELAAWLEACYHEVARRDRYRFYVPREAPVDAPGTQGTAPEGGRIR